MQLVVSNDLSLTPTASGGAVLYTLGENLTALPPISYVDYRLRFSTAGSYKLYVRARADEVWAAGDQFTANSFRVPLTFDAPFADATDFNTYYVTSVMNASAAQATPSSTNFAVYAEAPTYEVTQAMVDSGQVVVLRLGSRERGVRWDRMVLSTDPALTTAGFNSQHATGLNSESGQILGID